MAFVAAHTAYWSQYPGKYAHWRFGEGFSCGWEDAWMFLVSEKPQTGGQVNELGFRGARAKRSTADFGEGFWEYGRSFFCFTWFISLHDQLFDDFLICLFFVMSALNSLFCIVFF
jgi:hypothetical protein